MTRLPDAWVGRFRNLPVATERSHPVGWPNKMCCQA